MSPNFELIVQAPPLLLPEPVPLLPPSPDEFDWLFDELLHAVTAMTEPHPKARNVATARLTLTC
jgi:hypothetical protein